MGFRDSTKYIILLGIFIGLYVVATLGIPPDPAAMAKYDLTASEIRLLSFTILIPYAVIWAVAFYGFIRFKQYSELIKDTPDGRPLNTIADGHMILALYLPIITLAGSLVNYLARTSPGSVPAAVILRNYLNVAIALLGFLIIIRGARALTGILKKKPPFVRNKLLLAVYLAAAVLYCYITLTSPIRQVPGGISQRATYYLPDWLIVTTIIVPHLISWYLGLRAASYVSYYKDHISGRIYKPFLSYLVAGIHWVIFSLVSLQIFAGLSNSIATWNLRPLLILIYILLVFISVGYVYIALGASKLKRIEEV